MKTVRKTRNNAVFLEVSGMGVSLFALGADRTIAGPTRIRPVR
jgi:hypothetical protein